MSIYYYRVNTFYFLLPFFVFLHIFVHLSILEITLEQLLNISMRINFVHPNCISFIGVPYISIHFRLDSFSFDSRFVIMYIFFNLKDKTSIIHFRSWQIFSGDILHQQNFLFLICSKKDCIFLVWMADKLAHLGLNKIAREPFLCTAIDWTGQNPRR